MEPEEQAYLLKIAIRYALSRGGVECVNVQALACKYWFTMSAKVRKETKSLIRSAAKPMAPGPDRDKWMRILKLGQP